MAVPTSCCETLSIHSSSFRSWFLGDALLKLNQDASAVPTHDSGVILGHTWILLADMLVNLESNPCSIPVVTFAGSGLDEETLLAQTQPLKSVDSFQATIHADVVRHESSRSSSKIGDTLSHIA